MKSQQLMLIVSVVIAAAAGFLAFNYLSAAGKGTAAVVTRRVVVAAVDIPAREKISEAMLKTVDRSSSDVDADALSNPKEVISFLALTAIPKGATITASRVGKPENDPLTNRLHKGMRALTIPIDTVRGVAGLVKAGDYVDVIAVSSRNGPAVETALHRVLVLAMGSTLEGQGTALTSDAAPNATSVTLELTPKQAELLTLADSNSQLRLALRSPGDKSDSSKDHFTLTKEDSHAPAYAAMPISVPAAAPAAPAPVQQTVQAAPAPEHKATPHELIVTVIDGDHVVGSSK